MRATTAILLSATASTLALPALAADYDPPIFVEEVAAAPWVPVEIGSGWYLRGDVTYTAATRTADPFAFRTYDAVGDTYASDSFDSASLNEDFSFGGGVGYHFTDLFRMDATLDYGRLRFGGENETAAPCPDPFGGPVDTGCRTEASGEASVWSGLLNAYVDLGTVSGFTPYVGAGAGYSYLSWDAIRNQAYCVDGVAACADPAYLGETSHPGESDWRFTWAVMAGVAWDATQNIKVDLGYRYRRIEGGDMFGFNSTDTAAGATGVQGRDSALSQHQVRVGLRYSLW